MQLVICLYNKYILLYKICLMMMRIQKIVIINKNEFNFFHLSKDSNI